MNPTSPSKSSFAPPSASFGPVTSAEVVFNEKGSKGFGFVTLETAEQCTAAIEKLNGTKANGRKIEVKWASARVYQPKKPKQMSTMHVNHTPETQVNLLAAQQQALATILAQQAGILTKQLLPQQQPMYGIHPAYLTHLLQNQLIQRNQFLNGQVLLHQPVNGSRPSQKLTEQPQQGWSTPANVYQQLAQQNMQLQAEQMYMPHANPFMSGFIDASQILKSIQPTFANLSLLPPAKQMNIENKMSGDTTPSGSEHFR